MLMRSILAGFMVISAMQGVASAEALSGGEIKQKITNKRIYLATSFGIEFPLVYKKNGRVTGDGTGTGLGQYFSPKETGTWWISNNQVCQQFPTWYKGRTFCFSIQQTGPNSIIWKRDDGRTGKARIG